MINNNSGRLKIFSPKKIKIKIKNILKYYSSSSSFSSSIEISSGKF